jgi:hypothetical protein
VKAAWVTGDTVYGGDYKLRSWLEERLQPYVLAVPKNQRIGLTHRADEVVASWEASAWQRLSAGEGSQGPRFYDWAWQELSFRLTEPGWKQWLLARRSRWPWSRSCGRQAAEGRVEEAIELAKQQVGLDDYEVRHWKGWYRHITLAMFALAFLTVVKVAGQTRGPKFQSKKSLSSSLWRFPKCADCSGGWSGKLLRRQKEFCTGRDGAGAIKPGPNTSTSNGELLA